MTYEKEEKIWVIKQLFGGAANADTVALDFQGFAKGGFNYTQGCYESGFAFKANRPITITQLGYYDATFNGGVGKKFGSHAVGMWNITTHPFGQDDCVLHEPRHRILSLCGIEQHRIKTLLARSI